MLKSFCHVFIIKNLIDIRNMPIMDKEVHTMTIAATVEKSVLQFKPEQIFTYGDIPEYRNACEAVVKAMSRLVAAKKLAKAGKGQFYIPRQGILGPVLLGDAERLETLMYKDGRQIGYVTGAALFNKLGLSTQQPKTIEVASLASRQKKDFGTIRVRLVPTTAPVENNVPLLELLDALKSCKKIPDTPVDEALLLLQEKLNNLVEPDVEKIQQLAMKYYPAATNAILGTLLVSNQQCVLPELKNSLNPSSRYKIGLSPQRWPQAKEWFIQ